MTDFFKNLPQLHPEGVRFVAIFAGVMFILLFIWPPLGLVGLVLTLWCIYFFRDPERVTPQRSGLVIAPADGVICAIERAPLPKELNPCFIRGYGCAFYTDAMFLNGICGVDCNLVFCLIAGLN